MFRQVPRNAWNLYCWWINLTRDDSCREAWRVGLKYEMKHKKGELSKLSSLCYCLIITSDTNITKERFIMCTRLSSLDNWMLNTHRAHLPDIWSPSKLGSSSFGTKDFSSLPKHASFPPRWWTSTTLALVHLWTVPGQTTGDRCAFNFLGVSY